MYKVIIQFADLQDGGHLYNVGDAFPRQGLKVSETRLAELSGEKNLRHIALIEKIEEKAKEKTKENEKIEDKKDDEPKPPVNVKGKPRKKK